MYLIAGLGNPDGKYDRTRHNIGFRMVEALADKLNIDFNEKKFKGIYGRGMIGAEKVILAKPHTYMNLSGDFLKPLADYYKIPVENVIVLYDDISLDVGKIRIRKKGSAGGHNGIKSIIAQFGSEAFPRLRFGVGDKPAGMDLANYVLGRFSAEEEVIIQDGMKKVCDAIECMITESADAAMNKYNG